MTTKKLVIIVSSIVIAIVLLIVIFVGAIVGLALYSVGNSEAAVTAKDFLRHNGRLKQEIGEVNDFGKFVTGNINLRNGDGEATVNLKVIGDRATVNASVELIYRNGRAWHVTAASYKAQSGQTVELLNPYESRRHISLLVSSL